MSLDEDVERAARAEKLLNDDLLVEAFASVRMAIFEKIEATPVRDKEGLSYLHLMLKCQKDARKYLEHTVRNGKVAANEIKIKNNSVVERLFR